MKTPLFASSRSEVAAGVCLGLLIGAVVLALIVPLRRPAAASVDKLMRQAHFADFGAATASPDAQYVANWIADSQDNSGVDFVMVDKKHASIYVFDRNARLRAWSAVLLGTAPGDDAVAGIGSRPLSDVQPEERTTPAGRFIGERGHNLRGEDVVWVDYDAAISIHRVLTTNPEEHRLERLATPSVEDNRISYGCINVPAAFYETYISPIFAIHRAVVYVLPEFKPVQEIFRAYDVAVRPG